MDFNISGKCALVTGAARGIGRTIAQHLAEHGARVAICARTQSDLDSVMDELGGEAKGHFSFTCDLIDRNGPEQVEEALARQGFEPSIIINNAGSTLSVTDPYCDQNDWDRVFNLNFHSIVGINRLLAPKMEEKKWGRIINICSTASFENNGPITYCSAKAALAAYTHSFGRVLAPTGVVMSGLIVGAVYTEGGHWDVARKERPEHVEKYIRERLPMGDFGTTDDIAHMVSFLCSEQAKFCQGSLIPIDGGQSRHFFNQVGGEL